RPVVGEPQAHGVRWVEKQLLRGEGQHYMGVGHVEGDVALAGGFLQQAVGQPLWVAEGVADQQPPPAAVEGDLGQAVLRLLALLGVASGWLAFGCWLCCAWLAWRLFQEGMWPRRRRC